MFDTLSLPPAVPEDAPVEQILAGYQRVAAAVDAGAPIEMPPPDELAVDPAPWSTWIPSGWLGVELGQASDVPAALSDADLIEGVIAFDRMASWAGARQAALLAEFARRRPGDHPLAANSDIPSRDSEFAPDEVALALRLSRTTAANRLVMAEALTVDLPGTLAAWETGVLDTLKARAITETSYLLPPEKRGALETRVLPRAGTQTIAQLRAALTRAVLALDLQGAAERHQQRRKGRRVVVSPDEEGMASLWALLSASDATAAYQRLCDLARGLGGEDPRRMDARRADLLVELLTGRRCAATGSCLDLECGCADDPTPDTAAAPSERTTAKSNTPRTGAAGSGHGGHSCSPSGSSGTRPGKPLVSVIVPITMLPGLDEQPAELVGYGPIPADLAREIAAEGTWRRLLTDPASGALLDYGRTIYTPPVGLADFVRARDLHCRFPTCQQRAATADLDHTIPYPDGATSERNLNASCRRHHRLKTHTSGWDVDQHSDGRITWTTPTGHTHTSQPHVYRPDPHPPPDVDPPPF
ncbi:MAG: HNH endonuclease [Actinomycetota bacterium]|nr:HNH endonuclease [Actinomycetota bacterium]